MMQQKKGKKIILYLFLLIFVSSLHNINLNNFNFYNIKNINIFGLNKNDNNTITKDLENLNLKNIFFIDASQIIKTLDENPLVENYEIFKKYPSSLNFNIKKTIFLAKININGKSFIVGSNGKLIKDNNLNIKLPYIFGEVDVENFLKLKSILNSSKFSFSQIKNFYFFPSKRWDIELTNKLVLKLPKDNIQNALNNAFEFLKNKNLQDIKSLDLRIENQIIIND